MVYNNRVSNAPIHIVIKLVTDIPKILNSNLQNFETKLIWW